MICPSCGESIVEGSPRFCPFCGTEFEKISQATLVSPPPTDISLSAVTGQSSAFKTVGLASLLLLGVAILLGSISYYVDFQQLLAAGVQNLGSAILTFLGLSFMIATALLVISVLTMAAGILARRGSFPVGVVVAILVLSSVAFILYGTGLLFVYSTCSSVPYYSASACSSYGSILDSGIVSLIAGATLVITTLLSLSRSAAAKVTGSIFALAFSILLVVKVSYGPILAGEVPPFSSTTGYYSLFANVSGLLRPLGILDGSYFSAAAFIVVSIGLLIYAVLMHSRSRAVGYVVALVGFMIFAIGITWGSLGTVVDPSFWSFVWSQPGLGVIPATSEMLLIFAGFLMMAASALGIAVYAQSTGPARTQSSVVPVTPLRQRGGLVCQSCGTENPPENLFCRQCGMRLAG
jgi:hypothetical protein